MAELLYPLGMQLPLPSVTRATIDLRSLGAAESQDMTASAADWATMFVRLPSLEDLTIYPDRQGRADKGPFAGLATPKDDPDHPYGNEPRVILPSLQSLTLKLHEVKLRDMGLEIIDRVLADRAADGRSPLKLLVVESNDFTEKYPHDSALEKAKAAWSSKVEKLLLLPSA
jgi:hypothetical protein